jgi:P27 family predicted phage terminase small subunit
MAGRKPKPTAQKKLAGNPGKRALNQEEPRLPEFDKAPSPPPYLSVPAKKEWKRVAPLLHASRVLTTGDITALEAYCIQYGYMVEAQKEIKKHGLMIRTTVQAEPESTEPGAPKKRGRKKNTGAVIIALNPMFEVQQKVLTQMRQFMVEFGLTPSSRSRIHVPPAAAKDEFGDFLSGK